MSHLNNTTKNRKGKHLNYEDRLKIAVNSLADAAKGQYTEKSNGVW